MMITASILSALGAFALAFGSWGRFSESGKKKYDEMAGMIPYFSYYLGILLLIIAIGFWGIIIYSS